MATSNGIEVDAPPNGSICSEMEVDVGVATSPTMPCSTSALITTCTYRPTNST